MQFKHIFLKKKQRSISHDTPAPPPSAGFVLHRWIDSLSILKDPVFYRWQLYLILKVKFKLLAF